MRQRHSINAAYCKSIVINAFIKFDVLPVSFQHQTLTAGKCNFILSHSCCVEKLVAYQREFHALRERLRAAEHRTLQRSSELNTVLEQFRRAIAETNGSKDALTNFSGKCVHSYLVIWQSTT